MKKGIKKIMTVALVLALVFTFTVKPKKADAFIGEMTLAGIAATVGASAMLPYALGAAGILAVGGVIKNWDVVKDYGEKVIAKMGGYDAASGSYVQNPDGTATIIYSPAMKLAMAQSVDAMPEKIVVSIGGFSSIGSYGTAFINPNYPSVGYEQIVKAPNLTINMAGHAGDYFYIKVETDVMGSTPSLSVQADGGGMSMQLFQLGTGFAVFRGMNYAANNNTMVTYTSYNPGYGIATGYYDATFSYSWDNVPATTTEYDTADTFGTVADNVNARLLGMNTVIADNQSITYSADAELLNASIDDLASISDATLSETQTQTGILSQIWNGIKNLTGTIVAASSAAASAINTKAQDLWDDAGAIWTGIADTATGIKADMNAKIGSLSDSMAGGIDNIRTGINDMMANLRTGIDTVATNLAAWGQLTLEGIDAGVGAITSGLTSVWEKVAAIPAAIDTAATNTIETVTGWFVLSEPQKLENQQNMSSARELFLSKFDWIKTPIEQLKSVYSQRKSLHDVSVTIVGQEVYILPQQFAGTVSMLRSVLSGSAILTTIIYIYRRVQPKEVV